MTAALGIRLTRERRSLFRIEPIHKPGYAVVPLHIRVWLRNRSITRTSPIVELARLLHLKKSTLDHWLSAQNPAPIWRIKQIQFAIEEELI